MPTMMSVDEVKGECLILNSCASRRHEFGRYTEILKYDIAILPRRGLSPPCRSRSSSPRPQRRREPAANAQLHAEPAEVQPALVPDGRELDLSLVRHCLAPFFRILCSALPLAGYPASRCRISGSAAPDIRFWPAGYPAQGRPLPSLRRPRAGFALGLAGLRATPPWRISAKCLYAVPFSCELSFIVLSISPSFHLRFTFDSPLIPLEGESKGNFWGICGELSVNLRLPYAAIFSVWIVFRCDSVFSLIRSRT